VVESVVNLTSIWAVVDTTDGAGIVGQWEARSFRSESLSGWWRTKLDNQEGTKPHMAAEKSKVKIRTTLILSSGFQKEDSKQGFF